MKLFTTILLLNVLCFFSDAQKAKDLFKIQPSYKKLPIDELEQDFIFYIFYYIEYKDLDFVCYNILNNYFKYFIGCFLINDVLDAENQILKINSFDIDFCISLTKKNNNNDEKPLKIFLNSNENSSSSSGSSVLEKKYFFMQNPSIILNTDKQQEESYLRMYNELHVDFYFYVNDFVIIEFESKRKFIIDSLVTIFAYLQKIYDDKHYSDPYSHYGTQKFFNNFVLDYIIMQGINNNPLSLKFFFDRLSKTDFYIINKMYNDLNPGKNLSEKLVQLKEAIKFIKAPFLFNNWRLEFRIKNF